MDAGDKGYLSLLGLFDLTVAFDTVDPLTPLFALVFTLLLA